MSFYVLDDKYQWVCIIGNWGWRWLWHVSKAERDCGWRGIRDETNSLDLLICTGRTIEYYKEIIETYASKH